MKPCLLVLSCILLLGLGSCTGKKAEEPKGPSKAEVVKQHKAAVEKQLENFKEVMTQAFKVRLKSLDSLGKLDNRLPVKDVVLNYGDETPRKGNARLILFRNFFIQISSDTIMGLDCGKLRSSAHRKKLPELPWQMSFDPHFTIMLNDLVRRFRKGKIYDPEKPMMPGAIADIEEFIGLKYILVLRTAGFVKPQRVDANTVRQGLYAGQVMVFDLQKRKLVGTLSVVAKNKVGKKTTSVDWDLSAEIRKELGAILEKAKGK